MRVAIARTMPNFSMDVYADGLVAGLKTVRPDWDIIELKPLPLDRRSSSLKLRIQKYYERFWHFPRLVQRQKVDLVHIIDHSEAHIAHWLRRVARPTVVTCHDLINFYYRDNLQGSVTLPLISHGTWLYSVRSMRQADRIVTVSTMTAKDTTQILGIAPDRIAVVPNAVEAIFQPLPEIEAQTVRQSQEMSPDTLCLLNVGANHPRKNVSILLEVIRILRQKDLPIQLWKVGADFTAEQKQFIQTHQLVTSVRYLGTPDKSGLVRIYNAADLLVAPSLHEGFGMTILEAMACGTPVITSNVSAMPEVAGEAAVLVDPRDAEAIAQAVVQLHKDPVYYQALVKKGLERVQAFTWEKTAEQIADVYETLLKKI